MEVTRLNLKKVLPEIEDTINKCTFLAIDGEFTGLSSGLEKAFSAFDTPAEYYAKLKSGSIDFLFIQFGLAAFMYNEESKKYIHRAYNFYVFPRPLSRQAPDCRFVCQASSLDFLASNGFNFNKLFNEGIPYLNKPDEQAMREKLNDMRERRKSLGEHNNSFVECPPEHKDKVGESMTKIVDFLTANGTSDKELSLPQTNGFVRKLIYQEIWKKYTTDDLCVETKNGIMVVKRPFTKEERDENERKKLEDENAEIEDAIGFSKVINLISKSGKLVVGHNMLLDLCHILHRFCTPLPDSYEDFKQLLHSVFPHVLDTKLMCSSQPLADLVPSSFLEHVLSTVQESPFTFLKTEAEEGEPTYSTTEAKQHEAGYDAFITGLVAIALSNFIRDHGKHKKIKPSNKLPSTNSPHLSRYLNRLYMMKVADTFIDLEANDPEPDRSAVFHVTFPEEWKLSDLTNMFSPYGGAYVSWINSRSAYCKLNNAGNAAAVSRHSPPSGVTIVAYQSHRNRTVCASPPQRRSQERRSMKRPSVEPIPEEPEGSDKEENNEGTQPERKKRKCEDGVSRSQLFEENVDW